MEETAELDGNLTVVEDTDESEDCGEICSEAAAGQIFSQSANPAKFLRRYPRAEQELPPVIRPQWKGDEGR